MRKRITITLVVLVLFLCFVGLLWFFGRKPPKQGILIVNGTVLNSGCELRDQYHGVLPLLEVLEGLGVTVIRTDDCAEIINGDTRLSLSNSQLIDTETGMDWLTPAPGTTYYICTPTETDVLVDENTLSVVLHALEIRAEINIHYQKGEISVTQSH